MSDVGGTVVLLGGDEVGDPVLGTLLRDLAGEPSAAVLPMAAAFEHPERSVIEVATWLGSYGFEIEGLMAISRSDAGLEEMAARVDEKHLAYLCDGAALHLRTTLRATTLFERLEALLARGGVLVASGAAASVLSDPMVDPRGGAPTVGLGLVRGFCVIPHVGHDPDDVHQEKLARSLELMPADLFVVALPVRTALCCHPDGSVSAHGAGEPVVLRAGERLSEGVRALEPWC